MAAAKSGNYDAALKAYKAIGRDAPPPLASAALYNAGNLQLRQALKEGPDAVVRALPLIELAKQSYRAALRRDPGDWDTRYNLERALWLAPEVEETQVDRIRRDVEERVMSTLQSTRARLPALVIRTSRWFVALALLILRAVHATLAGDGNTFDYIVVFDITQSMDVEDYEMDGAPVESPRLCARTPCDARLRRLPCGTRIGWGAFAEYRSLLLLSPVEVCENYNDLLASLDNIDGRMRWANASEVGKGVYWAVRTAHGH